MVGRVEMWRKEYDFFTWTSFPNSLKLINDELRNRGWVRVFHLVPVTPSSTVKAVIKGKTKDVLIVGDGWKVGSYLTIHGSETGLPETWRYLFRVETGYGTRDWKEYSAELVIPPDIKLLLGELVIGGGTPEKPAYSWFDDLKIYQDDKLIYTNYFTASIVMLPFAVAPLLVVGGVVTAQELKKTGTLP